MSVKCKYSDIKDIFEWCEKYADEEAKELIGTQPSTHIIAYYTPSNANWSYQVGVVWYKNSFYEVVLVFGEVRAVRLCQISHYLQANDLPCYKGEE